MKRSSKMLIGMMLTLSLSISLFGCKDDDDTKPGNGGTFVAITDSEKSDLLFLREEEKLARDVYLYTYDKYGQSISLNISNSEQTHMDRVLSILTKYGVSDPAHPDRGVFNDSLLQSIYNDLISKVDSSLLDGMIVGAIIEDLDIHDIQGFLQRTSKTDLVNLYESLMCGSRNHLRSYYSSITSLNSSYSPQYISQSEFDAIIAGANEKCGN